MALLLFRARTPEEARLLAVKMAAAVRWPAWSLERRGAGLWSLRPESRS